MPGECQTSKLQMKNCRSSNFSNVKYVPFLSIFLSRARIVFHVKITSDDNLIHFTHFPNQMK